MKKKTLAVLLAAALGASMLWGCGKGNDAGASAITQEDNGQEDNGMEGIE